MSDCFVKEIRAIQYKNKNGNSNKYKVDKFVKSIVGDNYYVEEEDIYIKLLRTFDKSNVIGNLCNVLYNN